MEKRLEFKINGEIEMYEAMHCGIINTMCKDTVYKSEEMEEVMEEAV